VSHIEARIGDGSALDKLETAVTTAEVLAGTADDLIQTYVDQARRTGHSWGEIGERFGVTKQAARQRFGSDLHQLGGLSRLGDLEISPRLKLCLDAAALEAEETGVPIRTDHQLIGLFREGVAAAILEKLGVSPSQVRSQADAIDAGLGRDLLADTAETRRTLEKAAWMARRAGSDFVGTEHLLAALIFDPGSRARRVLQALDFNLADAKRELSCYLEPQRPTRRRRRREAQAACSFCGKQRRDDVRLVAGGPGVWICQECITQSSEILNPPT